jgi:hypothetical protein
MSLKEFICWKMRIWKAVHDQHRLVLQPRAKALSGLPELMTKRLRGPKLARLERMGEDMLSAQKASTASRTESS